MSRLKIGTVMAGLAMAILLLSCSKKIAPDQPDLFPNLDIVRTNPVNGATNVADSVNLFVTFNTEILDPSYVGLVMAPAPPEFYSRLQLSPDRKTISSAVKLDPQTVYSLVVFFAQDKFQDRIAKPYIMRFTTGASLPQGLISGESLAPFNSSLQGFVGLLKKNPQSLVNANPPDDQAFQQNLAAVAPILNSAGEFQFENVPPGTYWPFAGKDEIRDNRFSLASGDLIQAYDRNNDGVPDSVTVGAGQTLSAIHLNLPVTGMKVVSTIPPDGTTNVSLNTDFAINFSAPVDTSADFGLFAAPIPEGLSPSDLIFSSDLKTLKTKAKVNLQSNTAYTVVLYGVRSRNNQVLPAPKQVSFTTGNAFPAGEIRGTATSISGTVSTQHALVGLLNTDLPDVIQQVIRDPSKATDVLRRTLMNISYVKDASGNFVISHIPSGTYWLVGVKDDDGSIAITDPIGFYDRDNDSNPTRADSLAIAEGAKLSGITIIFP